MDITRPQQPGYYVDRDFDCRVALKPLISSLIHKDSAPFIDMNWLVEALSKDALAAG